MQAWTPPSETFGKSSSRLVVPMDVQVRSDSAEKDAFVGPGASKLVPDSTGSYITMQGEQVLELSSGGWTLEFPPSGGNGKNNHKGRASTLRFWMDLKSGVERNDIRLPAGERLYFVAKAWREDDYEIGLQRMRPIYQRYQEAQRQLDEQLSHESGDRRLDGNDALDTLKAYGAMAQLVLDRNQKRQDYVQALEIYPPVAKDTTNNQNGIGSNGDFSSEGPWPGSEEWLTLSSTRNPILIKAPRSAFALGGDDYHAVGTWTATPILSEDDDYVLV